MTNKDLYAIIEADYWLLPRSACLVDEINPQMNGDVEVLVYAPAYDEYVWLTELARLHDAEVITESNDGYGRMRFVVKARQHNEDER